MHKEDIFEAIANANLHRRLDADWRNQPPKPEDKDKQRGEIAAATDAFLAAGGKVQQFGRHDHGYKFEGFGYRIRLAGSLPHKEKT